MNTEMIDKLVSDDAYAQLDKLDRQLANSYLEMEKLLKEANELSVALSKSGQSFSELSKNIEREVQIEQKYTQIAQNQNNLIQQKTDLTNKVISAVKNLSTAESDSYEAEGHAGESMKKINALLAQTNGLREDNVKQLIVSQKELSKLHDRMKMLEKQLESGVVTSDAYIEKRAQMIMKEQELKQTISGLQITMKNQVKIDQSRTDTMEQESLVLTNLRMAWRLLSDEKKNTAAGKQLLSTINELDQKLKENDATIGNHQRKVGNYEIVAKTLRGELGTLNDKLATMALNGQKGSDEYNRLAQKAADLKNAIAEVNKETGKTTESTKNNENIFKRFTTVVNRYWAAILAGYKTFEKALSTYKDIMMSNIGTGREFKATMDGVSNALDYLKTAIARMDFTNLIEGLKEAARQGAQASLMLAELFERRNSFSLTSKPILAEIGELMVDLRNVNLSQKERLASADKIIEKTRELRNHEKEIQQQEVEANTKRLKSQTKMTDAEIEYYVVNYEGNRKQIQQAEKIAKLEEDISKERSHRKAIINAEAPKEDIRDSEERERQLNKEIELAKKSEDYNEMAYNARKKYQNAGENYVEDYVKSQEKLLDIDIAVNRELRMTERLRNSIINENKNAQNKDLKRTGEINTIKYRKNADLQKRVYDDEKNTFNERRDALRNYVDSEIAIIEAKEIEELKQEGLTKKQRELIHEKAMYEIFKRELEYSDNIKKLRTDEIEDWLKKTEEYIAIRNEKISQEMNAELLLADKVYSETIKANMGNEKERNRISKDYQMQRLEIIRQFNQKAFEEETKVLEASLDSTELTEKQKNDIRDAIRKLAMKNAKEITDYEIDMTKYKIDTMTTLEEEFNKFLNDKRTKAVQQMWSTAMDMANMYYDNELKRIDGLEKKDKEKYDAQLKLIEENKEAGSISDEEADARKRIIEASQAEREKQYEEQRKQIQQKQARWQKANAIIQATISTAGAVAAALPNVVLAAIVGAMGAAQVAMIASQQVPQYKEGTKGGTDAHPGGPAIVGDGGRSEMVILPDGRIWKTPAHDTLVSLPRGTEVLPDFKKACLEAAMRQPIPLAMDEGRGQTVFIQDEVIRKNTGDAVTEMREFNQNMRSFRKNSMYSENKLRIHKTLSKWR